MRYAFFSLLTSLALAPVSDAAQAMLSFNNKTMEVTAKPGTKIASTNNNFTTELKTIRDGWEYELIVTAKDTSNTSFGILKITTDSTVSRFRRTQAFVHVRRKSTTKKQP
ncbi:hypothetical protein [Rubritalea profundi]|uniref:Uncharacterized protein n=1 Tax=Rubritalea profundi TaxID=1658618 RepID=A0A2S7U161_9BACT|nr:hypothetical protein [Rubritalea profundi]PQJ28745.1 hypothetical protein BSZ32_09705 [Rubritalea profundi]